MNPRRLAVRYKIKTKKTRGADWTFPTRSTQSAKGAKEPSPDRKVGVEMVVNGSPGGRDTTKPYLIENIPWIKIHAVFLQQRNKLVVKRFLLMMRFLLVDISENWGQTGRSRSDRFRSENHQTRALGFPRDRVACCDQMGL